MKAKSDDDLRPSAERRLGAFDGGGQLKIQRRMGRFTGKNGGISSTLW